MDFNNNNPIFMQIADLIIDEVLAERLRSGERVSSVRELAAQVQVNPNTVQRAFTYLQDRGIIANKRGVGYFVAEDAFVKTRQLKKDEFLQMYLPEFVKRMKLLKIDLDELKTYF